MRSPTTANVLACLLLLTTHHQLPNRSFAQQAASTWVRPLCIEAAVQLTQFDRELWALYYRSALIFYTAIGYYGKRVGEGLWMKLPFAKHPMRKVLAASRSVSRCYAKTLAIHSSIEPQTTRYSLLVRVRS